MRHSLFVYDDDDRMVEKMAPFLCSGLADGERAVVVLDRRKWERLAGALGSDADEALYIERDTFYTRPEAALAGYDGDAPPVRARRRERRFASSASCPAVRRMPSGPAG